jgi:hypothetical protein
MARKRDDLPRLPAKLNAAQHRLAQPPLHQLVASHALDVDSVGRQDRNKHQPDEVENKLRDSPCGRRLWAQRGKDHPHIQVPFLVGAMQAIVEFGEDLMRASPSMLPSTVSVDGADATARARSCAIPDHHPRDAH